MFPLLDQNSPLDYIHYCCYEHLYVSFLWSMFSYLLVLYLPRSGISGWYSNSMFNYLRYCQKKKRSFFTFLIGYTIYTLTSNVWKVQIGIFSRWISPETIFSSVIPFGILKIQHHWSFHFVKLYLIKEIKLKPLIESYTSAVYSKEG